MNMNPFRFVIIISLMIMACPANGRNDSEFINVEKLSERVRLVYWVGTDRRCNLTAIKTQKGLVIIDTEMSPRIMAPIKQRIEQEFGRRDWAYVINTHAHDNHAGGNILFKGIPTIGHDNLSRDMEWMVKRQSDPDSKQRQLKRAAELIFNLQAWLPRYARDAGKSRLIQGEIKFWELHSQDLNSGYEIIPPSITFSDKHKVDCGDVQLELVFFGKGHSLSDTLIYVPQEKLLVTGAIVYQRAQLPEICEETQLLDVERFLEVLDRFIAPEVDIDHVIASHSMPLIKKDLVPVRDYYQRMLAGVRAAKKAGLTIEQTKMRLDIRNFPAFREKPEGNWSHGMHNRNLNNLWRIVNEEKP